MASYNKKDSVDVFLGTDTQGNPITDSYMFKGDSRYTEKSEDIARQYNWNMMNYLNWWNSPEQQVSRLLEAGLNPLFYLGGNAGTTPAASGGNLQGHQMTTADGRTGQIIEASKATADTLLNTQKQALDYDIARRQLNIESRRVDLEARQVGIQEAELGIKRERLPYEIGNLEYQSYEAWTRGKLNISNEQLNNELKNKTKEEVANLQVMRAKINKEIDAINAQIKLYASLMKLNDAQAAQALSYANYYDDIRWPMVEKLSAENDLTTEQAREAIARAANFVMDTNLKEAEIQVAKGQYVKLTREADQILIQTEMDKLFEPAERVLNMGCQVVNTAVATRTGWMQGSLNKARTGLTNQMSESAKEGITETKRLNELYRLRGEALLKLRNARKQESKDYWQKLINMWDEEIEKSKRGVRSPNTDINPTFDLGGN